MNPNVLHIIDSFEQGGTERQALQLLRLLRKSGRCRVHLACLQNKGSLRAEAEHSLGNAEIPEFPLNSFYDRNFLIQVRKLGCFLKQNQIDIVHTHDFYTNIFGTAAAAMAQVRVRVASKRETDGFRSALQKRLERGAFRLAHRVVANSEAVRQQLIREGARGEKIVTIYNGLDLTRVATSSSWKRDLACAALDLPLARAGPIVTILANLQHEVKDHPTFLRAAAMVHKAIPDSSFIIAGEGKLMPGLRKMAVELGLEHAVFFVGRCDRVADLLGISQVCVLSSRAEGFSNVILEYMGASRPVVATDVGGAAEAVVENETGYMVAAGDHEKMAARITQLLSEPERARAMGERGRKIVDQRFSCAAQVERVLALYDDQLGAPLPAHNHNPHHALREPA